MFIMRNKQRALTDVHWEMCSVIIRFAISTGLLFIREYFTSVNLNYFAVIINNIVIKKVLIIFN